MLAALDPSYVPVNEHDTAHGMVFAQALSAFLNYFDTDNKVNGNLSPFFSNDVSVRIAIAAVQNIDDYKTQIKSYLDYLNNIDNEPNNTQLIQNLSYIFSCIGSLAAQLDILKEGLPVEIRLKATLQNLIKSQLAPVFGRFISYYKGGIDLALVQDISPVESVKILNTSPVTFLSVINKGLSEDWIQGSFTSWSTYENSLAADSTIFGDPSGSTFDKTNHIATHNLFKSVLDQFLKVYARIITEAKAALQSTFSNWDNHDPSYTLFLSFLRLLEYARTDMNTLTGRHLDFYYREVLHLNEKAAVPGKVHLIAELAKHATAYQFRKGNLYKAGKDDLGKDAYFGGNRDFIANQAKVTSLKTIYRHGNTEEMPGPKPLVNWMRMFASPVANSGDGLGAALTAPDQSWQPFYNKIYSEGVLQEIRMPGAEVGFAIASHYLLMAEGIRTVTLDFTVSNFPEIKINAGRLNETLICRLTSEKGWIEKQAGTFGLLGDGHLRIQFELNGSDPAVRPYLAKVHGYSFNTSFPVLLVKMKNDETDYHLYNTFQDLEIKSIELTVDVAGLKTLAASNDFGPVDTSKPFQPFGSIPMQGSSFVIGSGEIFRKHLTSATIYTGWQTAPVAYGKSPKIEIEYLSSGVWIESGMNSTAVGSASYGLTQNLNLPVWDVADISGNENYTTASRNGFIRFKLSSDFGQKEYQNALVQSLIAKTALPSVTPVIPVISSLFADYTATQTISLSSADKKMFDAREAHFMHISPFGFAEQHSAINKTKKVFFLPQFDFQRDGIITETEAEFYIGVTGLVPPQNLSILFQVSDGTANPLTLKPTPHLHWSYLENNEWVAFESSDLEDQTDGFLKSGIVTLAVPAEATNTNTIFPPGEHWIRVAVSEKSDAVCNLIMVAAQAFQSTFTDKGNDPLFPSIVLPAGTISKALVPDAAVKKIVQPFESFGGRAAEQPETFYRRVSERLRHKDRAISLWDYEHLVLEAFPEIYRVKCLNHTRYEPNESGSGIYRELSPGHVTVVTVPNHRYRNLRDPLQPYTSLGLLEDITAFLQARLSCFVKLHVRNPQFEQVRIKCRVKLHEGYDETFYVKLLRESVTKFLSPWAFADNGSPTFGGKIYKSVLIDFIEEQSFVDYVTDFELFHDISGVKGSENKNEIEGSLAVSILVSVPSIHHEILVINPKEEEIPSEKCNCPS